MPVIEMAAHADAPPAQLRRPRWLSICKHNLPEGDGLVAADDALLLMAMDLLEVVGVDPTTGDFP
jgi:hypothetical protein